MCTRLETYKTHFLLPYDAPWSMTLPTMLSWLTVQPSSAYNGTINNGTAYNGMSDDRAAFVCTSKDSSTHSPLHQVHSSLLPQPMLHHEGTLIKKGPFWVGNKKYRAGLSLCDFSVPHFHN